MIPWRVPSGERDVAWPVLGPFSLIKLSKLVDGEDAARLAAELGTAFWTWIRTTTGGGKPLPLQLDEPSLGMVLTDADHQLIHAAYAGAQDRELDIRLIVTVQFGARLPRRWIPPACKGLPTAWSCGRPTRPFTWSSLRPSPPNG